MKKKVFALTLILVFLLALFVGCNMENGKVGDKDDGNIDTPSMTSSGSVVEEISSDINDMIDGDDEETTEDENATEMTNDKDMDKGMDKDKD
jgi:hypothetical protein